MTALAVYPVWILNVRGPDFVGLMTPLKRSFDVKVLYADSTTNMSDEALSSFTSDGFARLIIAIHPGCSAEPLNRWSPDAVGLTDLLELDRTGDCVSRTFECSMRT
jgi:hypothetical protein